MLCFKQTTLPLLGLLAFVGAGCGMRAAPQDVPAAAASGETDPVHSSGDAADDPAIWVNPDDPGKSLILGTDSRRGLAVYSLSGKELAFHSDGATGMVDVRAGFPLGGGKRPIVAAGNLAQNRIALYTIDTEKRCLVDVAARAIEPGLRIYGTCLYHSEQTGAFHVFVTSQSGQVEQWRLSANGEKADAERVRRFKLQQPGSDTIEGCVADDRHGVLYLAQENEGRIFRVGAEPDDPAVLERVDAPKDEGGHTIPDVEGLALLRQSDGGGWLLAVNQGGEVITAYKRTGKNAYVTTFRISGSENADAVTSDDSLAITSSPLGERFPKGLLVIEDAENTEPGSAGRENYKLVPLERVLAVLAAEGR